MNRTLKILSFLIFLLFGNLVEATNGFQHFEPLEILNKCEGEDLQNLSGSCFLLGIWAKRNKQTTLFNRIDDKCIEWVQSVRPGKESDLEPFLKHFPKCNYIFSNLLLSSEPKSLNIYNERTELVRFLNMK